MSGCAVDVDTARRELTTGHVIEARCDGAARRCAAQLLDADGRLLVEVIAQYEATDDSDAFYRTRDVLRDHEDIVLYSVLDQLGAPAVRIDDAEHALGTAYSAGVQYGYLDADNTSRHFSYSGWQDFDVVSCESDWTCHDTAGSVGPPGDEGGGDGGYAYSHCAAGNCDGCSKSPDGNWRWACDRHDDCYRHCYKSRKDCDADFYYDVRSASGSEFKARIYYTGVRWFGAGAYGSECSSSPPPSSGGGGGGHSSWADVHNDPGSYDVNGGDCDEWDTVCSNGYEVYSISDFME